MRAWLPVPGQLRTQLLWLVLIAFLPASGLVLYGNLEQQKLEKEGLRAQAVTTAKLAAASQEHYVKNARRLLGTLAEISWLMLATNRPGVDIHFRNLCLLSPDYADFGLIETNGRVFSSAAETNGIIMLTNASVVVKGVKTKAFCVSDFEP